MGDIVDLLWTFRSVQQRMILRDSLLTRQAGSVPSLQSLSRDAVLLILSTNNTQERLVTPLVDRLEGEITTKAMELLSSSYLHLENGGEELASQNFVDEICRCNIAL